MPVGKISILAAVLLAGLSAAPASAAPSEKAQAIKQILKDLRPIIRPVPPRGAPGPIAGAGLPFLIAAAAAAGIQRRRKRA